MHFTTSGCALQKSVEFRTALGAPLETPLSRAKGPRLLQLGAAERGAGVSSNRLRFSARTTARRSSDESSCAQVSSVFHSAMEEPYDRT
jgi:hypothetical protein